METLIHVIIGAVLWMLVFWAVEAICTLFRRYYNVYVCCAKHKNELQPLSIIELVDDEEHEQYWALGWFHPIDFIVAIRHYEHTECALLYEECTPYSAFDHVQHIYVCFTDDEQWQQCKADDVNANQCTLLSR